MHRDDDSARWVVGACENVVAAARTLNDEAGSLQRADRSPPTERRQARSHEAVAIAIFFTRGTASSGMSSPLSLR